MLLRVGGAAVAGGFSKGHVLSPLGTERVGPIRRTLIRPSGLRLSRATRVRGNDHPPRPPVLPHRGWAVPYPHSEADRSAEACCRQPRPLPLTPWATVMESEGS